MQLKGWLLLFFALLLLAPAGFAKEVTVIYNFPAETFADIEESISVSEDANAFSAFMRVAQQYGLDMNMTYYESFGGWFVNGINGINNTTEQYWHFWVNSEAATVGISGYVLSEDDVIELGFDDAPSKTAEAVVEEAVEWLAENQQQSGEIGSHSVWGTAFALIALNLLEGNRTVKQNAADYLLANQGEDAGFFYPGFDSDALHTAVSIMGLIANGLNIEDFRKDSATSIDFLLSKQENDGGFSGWGESDVDTTAWAAMAFNAAAQPLPTKSGKTPVDYLLSAQNLDGGFGYKAGQGSAQDFTAEALIAFASSGKEKDQAVEDALGWIQEQQSQQGCLSNAYTTALGAMALMSYDEDSSEARQCLKGLQLPDDGFGRDGVNSNAVDTALAAIALSEEILPTKKQLPDSSPDTIAIGSVAKFTVTITNTGSVSAKNVSISLQGIPDSWVQQETSELGIAEIKPNETAEAVIYVDLLEEGERSVQAIVSGTGVAGTAASNMLQFSVASASLSVSLSMEQAQ